MTAEPLVSIIINNYNYGRFLKEAIDSALNQTYKNAEVIVVDDGSTDESKEVILRYGNEIIPLFKENGGQGSAYNEGFLLSTGDLICNLDADDTLLPEAVESVVPFFEKKYTIKVQWPLWVVDKDGRNSNEITTKSTPPQGDLREMILETGPLYDFHLHTNSIVRRELLQNILPMPEAPYKNGGDVYVTTLAPIFGHIQNRMEPLGNYRVHGKNNYTGNVLDDERIRNYITRFETNCKWLEWYSKKLGYNVDQELWKQNFNYQWPHRLLEAKRDIMRIIPERCSYILINDNEWGKVEAVANRKAIPFLEVNGEYDGLPSDDAEAIKELERLKTNGAAFVVFWWTSFWWLEHYTAFEVYLSTTYNKLIEKDHMILFDLRNSKIKV